MDKFMVFVNYFDYFILYSVIGWVLESVYKSVLDRKIVNSGFLIGPYCPIYGLGALIMYFFLSGYNDNPVHVFVIGFVILSIWEYIVAWALEKVLHAKYWDYSNKKFNINGRVCLLNSFFWGVLGVVFIYVIHPFITGYVLRINNVVLIVIAVVFGCIMLIDAIVSTLRLKSVSNKLEEIKNIGEEIKEKLKDQTENTNEAVQTIINELRERESKLKDKTVKQTNRLRKAFPNMKSDNNTQIKSYIRK